MAAGILPKPGSEYLCKGQCAHLDCAHIRQDAAAICRICQKTIGYERRFYRETNDEGKETGGLVHAPCLEDEIEAEQKARMEKAIEAVHEVAAKHHAD